MRRDSRTAQKTVREWSFLSPPRGLEGRPESEGRGCQALLQLPQGKAKGRQLGLAVEHHALSGEQIRGPDLLVQA